MSRRTRERCARTADESQLPAASLAPRFARAVGLTPPKIAARSAAASVQGYWLDDDAFFCCPERFDSALGRTVRTPSIALCDRGETMPVILPQDLLELLSKAADIAVDPDALADATFAMSDRNTLLATVGDSEYVIDIRTRRAISRRRVAPVPALYSPDGRFACFVKNFDVWLLDRESGVEAPLTNGGTRECRYGQQPDSCLAPVSYRKQPFPVGSWSAESQWFLTHRIDERAVPELALMQHVPSGERRPIVHTFRFAMPGDALPVATYVAIHVPSRRVVEFDAFPSLVTAYSPFIFRRAWFGNAGEAWFVRFDRYAREVSLVRLDLRAGTGRVVLTECVQSGYLELNACIIGTPNVRTLSNTDEVIWFSEADGHGHLYLYDASRGVCLNQITRGNWVVRDIVHVCERTRSLLFLASGIDPAVDPARRSLCRVNFDGTGFEMLVQHDGDVFVAPTEPCGADQDMPGTPGLAPPGVSPDARHCVVRLSNVNRGNVTRMFDLSSREGVTLASILPQPGDATPRPFTALAADGMTPLHGVMFVPSDFDESRRYPLIDYLYPGPQIAHRPQLFQSVSAAPAMSLAEVGFATIMLDTRGMPIVSRAFHQAGYGSLLEPQLADHAAVVRQLCERFAFLDPDRIGVFGQSGGGAGAARALFDYPDVFRVGVAVCGNHDADRYSANWSNKYRGPVDETFASQANAAAAHKLRGALFLISGDMDENVHMSQTLTLVDALIRANRDFELLIVPNEGHSVMLGNGYVQRRIWDFFVRQLLGQSSPEGFEISFTDVERARMVRELIREIRQ